MASAMKFLHVFGVSCRVVRQAHHSSRIRRTFDHSSMSISPAVVSTITLPFVGSAIVDVEGKKFLAETRLDCSRGELDAPDGVLAPRAVAAGITRPAHARSTWRPNKAPTVVALVHSSAYSPPLSLIAHHSTTASPWHPKPHTSV